VSTRRSYRPSLTPGSPVQAVDGQLDLFAADTGPEPAPAAGPAPATTKALPPMGAPRTTVVDLHGHQADPAYAEVVYVGRPMYQGGWRLHGHPLSNPYKVGRDGSAETVVARYREWLLRRPGLTDQLLQLRGRRLGCWCADGAPCHARVLAELADQITTDR
jgi:hypothetical protein